MGVGSRVIVLYLLFLSCLQLEMNLMPNDVFGATPQNPSIRNQASIERYASSASLLCGRKFTEGVS